MLIRSIIEKYNLKNMVRYLCGIPVVSRSGYYNYFFVSSQGKRKRKSG
ncbi:Transposase [Bacillus cereus ATCC 14579]|uniref:Transposase n=1 Tax=Bacillus cereus (strain ATCC 14579 / DSM 31 / CCUG 7414 / JCM 2152 / NBRC 15305 / NCIMB 9373 / NCTC 2599 / NRRL B-3711) TaxID=226900 RepID=Q815P6_BACCR|nr:Transposase [Bacillus cereus ATCC 14579]